MEWAGLSELIDRLCWGSDYPQIALVELRRRTGLELGSDMDEWRATLRPRLIKETRTCLEKMKILSRDLFEARVDAPHSFYSMDLGDEVRGYLRSHVKGIWLSGELEYYASSDGFAEDVTRLTGTALDIHVVEGTQTDPKKLKLVLGKEGMELGTQPHKSAFELLRRWMSRQSKEQSFYIDRDWRAVILNSFQLSAVRRFRPFALRLLGAVSGEVPVDVTESMDILRAKGLDLDVEEEVLAWDIYENDPLVARAQLLMLSGAGIRIRGAVDLYAFFENLESTCPILFGDLTKFSEPKIDPVFSTIVEHEEGSIVEYTMVGCPRRVLISIDEEVDVSFDRLLSDLNRALAEARCPHRLIAVQFEHDIRVFSVPEQSVASIARSMKTLSAPSFCDVGEIVPFRPERVVLKEITDLVDKKRVFVFDAGLIEDFAGYKVLLSDLCDMTEDVISHRDISVCMKGHWISLNAKVGGLDFNMQFDADDYFDLDAILENLNDCAERLYVQSRFIQVRDPDWGEEIGAVFCSESEAKTLSEFGYMK